MDRQEREWNEHKQRLNREGKCEFSGKEFMRCAHSICDCGMEWWTDEEIREFTVKAKAGEPVE